MAKKIRITLVARNTQDANALLKHVQRVIGNVDQPDLDELSLDIGTAELLADEVLETEARKSVASELDNRASIAEPSESDVPTTTPGRELVIPDEIAESMRLSQENRRRQNIREAEEKLSETALKWVAWGCKLIAKLVGAPIK